MILRTSFCSCQLWRIRLTRSLPIPLMYSRKSGAVLEDFQGPFLVDADDLGGQLRPDAADRPGGQILFDAFRRGRVGGLEFVGLELLAVFPVHDPLAGGFQMLARRNRGRACPTTVTKS
jgi:hypothetical protein